MKRFECRYGYWEYLIVDNNSGDAYSIGDPTDTMYSVPNNDAETPTRDQMIDNAEAYAESCVTNFQYGDIDTRFSESELAEIKETIKEQLIAEYVGGPELWGLKTLDDVKKTVDEKKQETPEKGKEKTKKKGLSM